MKDRFVIEQIRQTASAKSAYRNLIFLLSVIPAQAGIQLLLNVLDTGKLTFHDVCRCNHDLTFRDLFNNIKPNNTLHASRRICAPWRVTFFLAMDQGSV